MSIFKNNINLNYMEDIMESLTNNQKRIYQNDKKRIEIQAIKIIANKEGDSVNALLVQQKSSCGNRISYDKSIFIASFEDISDYEVNEVDEVMDELYGFEEIRVESVECLDKNTGLYRDCVNIKFFDIAEGQYEEYFPWPWSDLVSCSCVGEITLSMDYSLKDYFADNCNVWFENIRDDFYRYIDDDNDGQVRYVFVAYEEYANDLGRYVVKKS